MKIKTATIKFNGDLYLIKYRGIILEIAQSINSAVFWAKYNGFSHFRFVNSKDHHHLKEIIK